MENKTYLQLKTVGDRITYLRKYYKYTQKDLAIILGVNQGTMSKYETDNRNVPYEVMEKLAHLFKVPIGFIKNGFETPPLPEFEWISPEDIVHLSNLFDGLKYLKLRL